MIGDLSTFIQYLAALYFTICIDGAFFRRFWSPDYYRLVTEIISLYKFQQSQTLKDKLNSTIKEQANKIEDHSVKRGVFMLLFCLFFLVYISFELSYITELDKTKEWLSLIMSTAYVTIILLMSGFSLRRWRWVVIHTLLFILIYFLMRSAVVVNKNNIHLLGWVMWFKVYLVVFLLLPILYQLYINWLYSQAYVQHLISTLNSEYERYLKTYKAINDKDKNLVEECYVKVFSDSYFDNNGQDVVITKFNQAVLDRLISACQPPLPIVLIKKWISIKSGKDNIETIKEMESQYQFPKEDEVIPKDESHVIHNNPQFDQLIQEYENLKGVSLSKFCKDMGVDAEKFQKYRKTVLKK